MAQKTFTGIDIGSHHVKVVIAAAPERPDLPLTILGTGIAPSYGMRHGYIVNKPEVITSIKEALLKASSMAKVRVYGARVAVGGVSLEEVRGGGEVSLTASGGTVTDRDIQRVKAESVKRASSRLGNRTVIDTIPLEYRLDGIKVYGNPDGMQGTKLSVDTLLITILSQHHDDIVSAVEAAGVEVEDVMASPVAASIATLAKTQRMAGVVLANIGAETLSIIVYDADTPISIKVFPLGSAKITEHLALTFQLPLTEAEQLKRGGVSNTDIPEKKIHTLISNQFKTMFTQVDSHLKSIGRQRLLPAGVVVVGGGSGFAATPDIARTVMKLPSQVGALIQVPRSAPVDATWAVAYGLARCAYLESNIIRRGTLSEVLSGAWASIKRGAKSFLP